MKKLFALLSVVLVLLAPAAALAEEAPPSAPPSETAAPADAASSVPAFDGTGCGCATYILVDGNTGQVLASQDPDEQIWPASTTKLMTALLLLETRGLEGSYTCGPEVNGIVGSKMGIRSGETVTVKDLFYGLLVRSGNDAGQAIAAYVAGDVDSFVAMMNDRAAQLCMENTHFVNPYGGFLNQDPDNPLPEEKLGYHHYSTAADMAKLAVEAAKHPPIMDAGSTGVYYPSATNLNAEPEKLENSNRLIYTPELKPDEDIYRYPYATGMKTGSVSNIKENGTDESFVNDYSSLVASAEKDGTFLIAVMCGDKTQNGNNRWTLAASLFDYGFDNYETVDLAQYIAPCSIVEQLSGCAQTDTQNGLLEIGSEFTGEMPAARLVDKVTAEGLKAGSIAIEQQTELTRELAAPVSTGEQMGTVTYLLDGQALYSAPLVARRDVYAAQPGTEPTNETEPEQTPAPAGGGSLWDKITAFEMPWWGWPILIFALFFATLLVLRAVNLSRRKRRRQKQAARAAALRAQYPPQHRRRIGPH